MCPLVRRAVEGDRQGVLEISRGVFEGYDHVPPLLGEMLGRDGRYLSHVCEDSGAVVGFATAVVVDEGKRVLFTGLRVKRDSRGKGYGGMLAMNQVQRVAERHPGLEQVLLVDQDNLPSMVIEPKIGFVNRGPAYSMMRFNMTDGLVQWAEKATAQPANTGLVRLNSEDASALLEVATSKEVLQALPIGRLFPESPPLVVEASPANVQMMKDLGYMWFKDRSNRTLSYGLKGLYSERNSWAVSVHSQDVLGLLPHLVAHLKLAAEAHCSELNLNLPPMLLGLLPGDLVQHSDWSTTMIYWNRPATPGSPPC